MSSHYNWDSYSHQQLYDRIHGRGDFFLPDGAGVSGAAGAQEGWAKLATLMAEARERTEAALARAGAVWEGGAADSMRAGITPLAQWADDSHVASTASQNSTDAHVGAYSSAKNHMPEPVRVTSTANSDVLGIPAMYTHIFGGQTDQDRQEAAAQEAKAEAVRVMAGYETESSGAQASVGRFVPPPSVTVDVAPSQSTGGSVIPVGEWPGASRVSDRSVGDTRGPGGTTPPPATPPPPGRIPLPPGHTPLPPGTNPSDVAAAPPLTKNPPLVSSGLDQGRSGTSVPGLPGGPSTFGAPGERGGVGRGPVGRGFGGGISEGGSGRGPGGAGPGAGGARGAMPGAAGEAVAGRAGAAGGRGAGGMGMGPVGGRNSDGDEDKEHTAAEYLRDFHDSFWDDTPPVAPSVIGDEDDD